MRVLITIFVLCSAVAQAQNFFTQLNGPFGGTVTDLVRHSGGALVVTTQNNGVWRSADSGISWSKTATGSDVFMTDMDIDASGNIYVVSATRIYRSTDGGLNFVNIGSTGIPVSIRKIKVADATTIYVVLNSSSGSYAVYKSNNAGTSFNLTSTDITLSPNDLDTDPSNPDIVYVATSAGIKVSTDGGFVFNTSTGSIDGSSFAHSVVVNSAGTAFAVGSGGVSTSSDNGSTWSLVTGVLSDGNYSGRVELDSAENLYFVNSAVKLIHVGNTTGSAWSATVSFPAHISLPFFWAESASTWFLASITNGVFKTTNAGASWVSINQSFKALNGQRVFVTDQGRIFITYTGIGYYQSIDNGATWSFVSAHPAAQPIYGFVKLADNSVIAYGTAGVLRSTGTIGNIWSSQNTTTGMSQVVTYDGINLFGYSGSNLLHSNDQGATWTTTPINGLNTFVSKIQVDVSNNVYVKTGTIGFSGSLYKIPFGTADATLINTAFDFSIVNSNAATTIYTLASMTQLQISTDGGVTWPSIKAINPTFQSTRVWAFRNNVVLTSNSGTSGNANVNVSYDAGSTWTAYPLTDNTARATDISLSSEQVAYIATSNSTAYRSTNMIIPPAAPTGLQVIGYNLTRADLLWDDNSDNEWGFVVEFSIGNNTSWQEAFTTVDNDAVQNKCWDWVNTFERDTTYYCRVAAINGAGKSAYSNEVSFITKSPCPTTIPDNRSWTGSAVADPGSTPFCQAACENPEVQILNTGGNAYRAMLYTFDIAPSGGFPERPSSQNSAFITFTENCGKVVVTSNNVDMPNGEGSWDSATNTLTLKWQSQPWYNFFQGTTTFVLNASDPAPATPSLSTYIYSSSEVLVNWSATAYATGFNVYRSTVSGGSFTLIASLPGSATLHIDKNLTAGTTYYYKVSAFNDNGESPMSAEQGILPSTSTLFRPIESAISANFENQQGVAWGDLDGDGDEDIAVPSFTNNLNEPVPPVMYENTGSNTFERRDLNALANENTSVSRGIGIFDLNNDGMLDMYVARSSDVPDLLLVNNGNWNFSKIVLDDTKVTPSTAVRGFGILDYDGDGFADVYLGNDNGGASPATLTNFLLKNSGGTTLMKVAGGIETTEPNNSRCVSAADYDNDGDQDLFATNTSGGSGTLANHLYENNGDGTFTKATGLVFDTDIFPGSRTISWGDIDNDGDLDLFVGSTSIAPADRLYRNNGDGTFTSLTSSAIAESGTQTYGSAFGDIDNDGDLDMIAVNQASNSIFLNDGAGTFTKYATQELLVNPGLFEIGGAFADFDSDGFLDFYPPKGGGSTVTLPNLLYKNTNTPSSTRHWVEIKLVGTLSNRAALGARIQVTTTSPARTQIRDVSSTTGYGSQNSLIQHFGLGSASSITEIAIRWPSGAVNKYQNVSVDQLVTYTEDARGPATLTLLPAHNATNVSSATKLEITLDENSTAVAGKKIKLTTRADPGTTVFETDVTTATKSGNTFSFTLPSRLNTSTTYQVGIDPGAFQDLHGNVSPGMPDTNWIFTIGAGPLLSGRVPAHSASNVNTTTSIQVTFNGTASPVPGKFIRIYKQVDTVNPVAELSVTNGSVNGNSYTFTLPSKLELSVNYTLSMDVGAFRDNLENPSAAVGLGSWIFLTTQGPQVTSLSPVHDATAIANDAALEITFDDNVTPVAGKKLKVMSGSTTVLDADVSTNGTISNGNRYVIEAPGSKWPYEATLDVTIDYGAFVDPAQNDFAGLGSGSWQFTTVVEPDVQAPMITPPTVTTLPKSFGTTPLTFTVTDNKMVESVVVCIRKISESTCDSIAAEAGTNAGEYTITLSEANHFDLTGTEFHITATDPSGNVKRSPAGSATQKILLTFTATDAQIPTQKLGFGGTKESWKIFSIPFELGSNNAVTTIFDEFEGLKNKIDYRLITYVNSNKWLEYPEGFGTIERGKGYFINIKEAKAITLVDNLQAPNNSRNDLFKMDLASGWNMIGNPYLTPISWQNVADYNDLTGPAAMLIKYSSTGYNDGDQGLASYEGGFVFSEQAIADVEIPFLGQIEPGRKGFHALGADISEAEWALSLRVNQDGISYGLGAVGMALDAAAGFDDYDAVTPPRFFDYLEVNFDHPEFAAKKFTRDIVPSQKMFTWNFTIDSNLEGGAELMWDNTSFSRSAMDLFLMDADAQVLVNMKETSTYTFNPGESTRFRIYYGENLTIYPDKVHLGIAFPNPTGGNTTISFTLNESGGASQNVDLTVFDTMGSETATLLQGRFSPGFHEVTWNAKELRTGFYTYRLTVQNKNGKITKVNKLVIK